MIGVLVRFILLGVRCIGIGDFAYVFLFFFFFFFFLDCWTVGLFNAHL